VHLLTVEQLRLDLAQLDAIAADLYLIIVAT
jgi:hypothetical protein